MSECGNTGGGLSHTADQLKRSVDTTPRLCPVCQVVNVHLRRHVDTLFYELVNDGPTRARIRRAGGFCRYHADLIAAQGDALGAALIFQDVLDNELCGLEAGDFNRPPHSAGTIARLFERLSSDIAARSPCPLCDAERRMDERGVDGLLEALGDTEFAELFTRSAGVCLRHFRLAFERCGDCVRWQVLLEHEKQALAALREELHELARKHDYRFRGEPPGTEGDAWLRALALTSGRSFEDLRHAQ